MFRGKPARAFYKEGDNQKLGAIFAVLLLQTGATFEAPFVCNAGARKGDLGFPLALQLVSRETPYIYRAI